MERRELQLGKHTLPWKGVHARTYVMGILNVTPDSFSDGGQFNTIDRAVAHAHKLIADGADILDIGGESTRPQATPVSLEEELERVIPVISAIAREVDVPISIDTYKAEVARQAIQAGAHLINDVWGARKDPDMAQVAAEYKVPIVLMHNRNQAQYESLMRDMLSDLRGSIQLALQAGVKKEQIIIDPGIGFAKSYAQNLTVLRHLDQIVKLGYPVLLGTSRKSFIGTALGGVPPQERVEGTAATVAYAVAQGCHIVRVHDVKQMVRVCRMMDAIMKHAE